MTATVEQATRRVLEMTALEWALPAPDPTMPSSASAPLDHSNQFAILQLAAQIHRQGHLEQAEPIYRRILSSDPNQAEALHLIGVLYHQQHDNQRALPCLSRAITLRPDNVDCLRHLGEVFRALQFLDEAIACFKRAISLDPSDADSMCNMGHAYLQGGRFEDAERHYRRAIAANENDTTTLAYLGIAIGRQGREEDARACYEAALALDPGNEEAQHMLAGLAGGNARTTPAGYVARLFDQYAESFDAHLVSDLQYTAPHLIRGTLEAATGRKKAKWRVADLGCGTGQCGEQLRDLTRHIVGVDLSQRMIEHARQRGIYDELIHGDLTEALEGRAASFDLVVAADVFIYVGELDHVFKCCRNALVEGGRLAFTTERESGNHFHLRPSGRFAHSESYIRALADEYEMAIESCLEIDIRLDQGIPIAGQLFVLRRDASRTARG